ncbi:unnamed protein product [Heterobilharzia americana]|nr:unnamed protein product [Heterobilharzia americana]
MAEFRKCFENLDTEKRGVITIDDLKTYMRKMHYKETFLHKWIELFDPDHNGFITYEQYCKTLGLIPRKRTISKNFTDSSASISPKHEDSSGILIHSSDLKTSISRLDPSEEHRTSKEQSSSHPDVVSQEQDSYIYTQENVEVIIPVAQKFSSPSIVEITSEQNDPVEDIESNNLIPKSTTTEEMLINEVETNLVCHEKMTGRKRKYADEKSELLIGNNIHSSINDQLLESDFIPNEVTNQMMSTEVIIMDQNECNPLEHLKSTSEVYSLPENLSQQKSQQIEQHILSNEQVLLSVPQKKSAKKSKKKRKQTLELSQQVEEMIVDDHLKSHENSHTSITCELMKNTDLHDTVVFESESCQTVTMKETLISDTQYQKEVIEKSVNVYDSHFQSDKPITIEEDNKDLIPSNDAPISKPGMSISIDSGNSEPTAAAPAGTHYKADTPSCNSGSSSQVFEVGSENSSPTPSAGVLIESSKLSNWSSSSEKISQRNNKTQDEELHDDSISEQMKDDGLSKKADKKKQNTHLDKIPDDPILSQSTDLIGQALIQSNISSTIIHDSDILPDEVQQASELLIDPQKIKSMHKTPQELTDESILTIVSSKLPDTEVSSTQLSSQASKNESKKSKKKHEKISHEVRKPLEVTTGILTISC